MENNIYLIFNTDTQQETDPPDDYDCIWDW